MAELVGLEDDYLHSQWIDLRRPRPDDEGLNRLRLGILESGMRDYLFTPRFRPDVRAWVDARDQVGPFTFEEICESLELDASAMRAGMRTWMARVDAGEIAVVRTHGGSGLRFKPLSGMIRRPKVRGRYAPRR